MTGLRGVLLYPRQLGGWAMLLAAFIIGAAAGGELNVPVVLFLLCGVFGLWARHLAGEGWGRLPGVGRWFLIAASAAALLLGARVSRNAHQEIGWFPVHLTEEARSSRLFGEFPRTFTPFHWHGDTFAIPAGAKRIAWSEGCANQAFEYGGRVVGLQFHLELSAEEVEKLLHHCGDEVTGGPYVQTADVLRAGISRMEDLDGILETLLCNLEASPG